MSDTGFACIVQQLEDRQPLDILHWAAERFAAKLTCATGFGVEGCVIIDMIGRHQLPIDLFTLDTGLLFPETYDLWRRLEERYNLTIRGVRPRWTVMEQDHHVGPNLWQHQPHRCCELRKLAPLRSALQGFEAWVTAIRRDQTVNRAAAAVVAPDPQFGLVKVNPLVAWTSTEVWAYVLKHDVPYNPLHDCGYPSIGCWPCTTSIAPGEDPRTGRWRGQEKTECGLHVGGTMASMPTP
jgi:phosphoadenylyl-sulfate reductase (thioredoxin)